LFTNKKVFTGDYNWFFSSINSTIPTYDRVKLDIGLQAEQNQIQKQKKKK
jgi:hypothetical protein